MRTCGCKVKFVAIVDGGSVYQRNIICNHDCPAVSECVDFIEIEKERNGAYVVTAECSVDYDSWTGEYDGDYEIKRIKKSKFRYMLFLINYWI